MTHLGTTLGIAGLRKGAMAFEIEVPENGSVEIDASDVTE